MKDLKIGKKAKVSLKWKVKSSDYTKEEENNIIAKFANKYGIDKGNITVVPDFITENNGKIESLAESSDLPIYDPKFQLDEFKRYMAKNGIDNIPFEEIEKIDGMINARIDYESYQKTRLYKIKSLRWNNFLSYGEGNFIDLTKYRGLVLLNGIPANKSGKSTFAYDLFRFALFGKTKSGKADKFEEYFNNYLPDNNEVLVECVIEIGGRNYMIRRKLTRSGKAKKTITNSVEYFEINPNGSYESLTDEDKLTNLQGETIVKTNKIIKETIGSEKDFDLIVAANAKDLDELIEMKETDRGRTLSRWTGLSILEDKSNMAGEIWNKEISRGRLCDRGYNRETLKNEIEDIKNDTKNREDTIKENDDKVKETEEKIAKLKKDRDNLIMSKNSIDPSIAGKDLHTLEMSFEKTTQEGLKKKGEMADILAELDSIGDVKEIDIEEKTDVTRRYNKCLEKVGEFNGYINSLRSTIARMEKSEVCEHSGKKCQFLDKTKVIADKTEELNNYIEKEKEAEKERDKLKERKDEIERLEKLAARKSNLELMRDTLNGSMDILRKQYTETKNLIARLKENENTIRENNDIDAKIGIVDAEIAAEERIRIGLKEENIALKKDIEQNGRDILEKESYISQLETERKVEACWNLYRKMIGKDGITKDILAGLVPKMNARLNALLSDIADFTVEIDIDFKNDIQLWLIRDGKKTKLTGASGYERTMAGLALRHVLGQSTSLSKPPFLLLDEILGGVAAENYDDIKKLYDKIVPTYDFVFHITHLNLDEWHDGIITVQKIDNISRLKTGQ